MVRRAANIFDVACAKTFLRTGGSSEFQFHIAEEMVLERIHPRRRKQNRWIPLRHQHVAGADGVSFGFVEIEIALANFVSFHEIAMGVESEDSNISR